MRPDLFSNWEGSRITPPLEQLQKLCAIYGISSLDLLDSYPTMNDIYHITMKTVTSSTYEEEVALAFCGDIGNISSFIDEK